jgi:hypothetical protein
MVKKNTKQNCKSHTTCGYFYLNEYKNIKLTSAYSKKLGYAFFDFVGLDMTAALSIFLNGKKCGIRGRGGIIS